MPGAGGLRWLWLMVLPTGAAAVLAAIAIWLAVDRWRLRRLAPGMAAAVLYERLRRYGGRLAVPMRAGDTPYEFGRAFARRMADLARGHRWPGVWAVVAQGACRLIEIYVWTSYRAESPGTAQRAQAIEVWGRLRWRLWLARVWGRWGRQVR